MLDVSVCILGVVAVGASVAIGWQNSKLTRLLKEAQDSLARIAMGQTDPKTSQIRAQMEGREKLAQAQVRDAEQERKDRIKTTLSEAMAWKEQRGLNREPGGGFVVTDAPNDGWRYRSGGKAKQEGNTNEAESSDTGKEAD